MSHRKIFIAPLLALSMTACQGENQQAGTLLGAVGGAIIGGALSDHHNGLAIALGALAGAWAGGEIGKSMDQNDRAAMQATTQQSLEYSESGVASSWLNPDSGYSGTVTPQPAYQADEGQYCREYQQTVTIGGETVDAYGTACRQPDGSWKVVESR
jgi:surface antigen